MFKLSQNFLKMWSECKMLSSKFQKIWSNYIPLLKKIRWGLGAGACLFDLGLVKWEYEHKVLPLRKLEELSESVGRVEALQNSQKYNSENWCTSLLDQLEDWGLPVDPLNVRRPLAMYVAAEVDRFYEKPESIEKYADCADLLCKQGYGQELLKRMFAWLLLDFRTKSDVLLMKPKCDAQILVSELEKIRSLKVYNSRKSQIERIRANACTIPAEDRLKSEFLAAFYSTVAQQVSKIDESPSGKKKALLESLVLINAAMDMLLLNDPINDTVIKSIINKHRDQSESASELFNSARTRSQQVCKDSDAAATVLYNWMVVTRNCNFLDTDVKENAYEIASRGFYLNGVRPSTKRNFVVMNVLTSKASKLMIGAETGAYQPHYASVKGGRQEMDVLVPYSISLALHGKYEKALAMFLYGDPKVMISVENLPTMPDKVTPATSSNRDADYCLYSFLLAACGHKEVATTLLQNLTECNSDQKLLLGAYSAKPTPELQVAVMKEIRETMNCTPNLTNAWWLACMFLILGDVDHDLISDYESLRSKIGVDVEAYPWRSIKNGRA